MLFGGGLTLGLLLESSGAARDVGTYFFSGELPNPFLIGCSMVVVSILMSEFASNTAAASILIPLILGATLARGVPADATTTVVLAATFGASFGFMLPVSTPPNAIVYGTGRVPARDMRRAGIFFDIAGALIIIGYMLVLR
jgi:sodium-dependent dicarboxylate transporter 2/3/5